MILDKSTNIFNKIPNMFDKSMNIFNKTSNILDKSTDIFDKIRTYVIGVAISEMKSTQKRCSFKMKLKNVPFSF